MNHLTLCTGFQWDTANSSKNWNSHQVSQVECEQVFFNLPLLLFDDVKHSQAEDRYYILGKTDNERRLFIVFTKRENLIRIISARDMNRKEREIYERDQKETT